MTEISLKVGTRYKSGLGEIVKIVRLLDPDNYDKTNNRVFTEAQLYEQGYRFESDYGDTYLPNGRFDIDEENSSMDLVEQIPSDFAVEHKLSDMSSVDLKKITATDAEEAVAMFRINLPYATPLRVYELAEVSSISLGT